jgi:hypothetical protein
VVREGIEVATGRRFAVKTVSKIPKRGAPTPRCVVAVEMNVVLATAAVNGRSTTAAAAGPDRSGAACDACQH